MRLTAGKIVAIGNLILTVITGASGAALLTGAGVSQAAAAYFILVCGTIGTLWNGIWTIILSPEQQAQSVAANIDEPSIKRIIVPSVSQLPGLDPLQTNSKADAALIALGADPAISKVLPPKA